MNIVSLETKWSIINKLKLLSELLDSFSSNKKQMKHIRRVVKTYCTGIYEENYLFEDDDKKEVDFFVNEIKEIASRFCKAKDVESYNRSRELLDRYTSEIDAAISKTRLQLAEHHVEAGLGSVYEKAKTLGGIVQQGVSMIRDAVSKKKED